MGCFKGQRWIRETLNMMKAWRMYLLNAAIQVERLCERGGIRAALWAFLELCKQPPAGYEFTGH